MDKSYLNVGRILMMGAALLIFVGIACGAGAPTTIAPPPPDEPTHPPPTDALPPDTIPNITVGGIRLYLDDGNGNAGEQVDIFHSTDRTLHFEADEEGPLVEGMEIKWVFTAVETTEGTDIVIGEIGGTVGNEIPVSAAQSNILTAYITLPNDWPTGDYQGDIYANNPLAYSFSFSIEE